ncbi:MAG: histidinol-phosphatase HisJ family protein [Defluviitaleaceae bacterium]|nr:histidinol-phosphatase HisJ family protein [Defluviitaleaceae bacterium]
MIKYDYHLHSIYSPDSHASIESMAQRAVDLGIEEIVFTDHINFSYPSGEMESRTSLEARLLRINKLKEEFAGRLSILTGAEIGLRLFTSGVTNHIADNYDFDILIASIHEVGKHSIADPKYYENRTRQTAYAEYYEHMLHAIKTTHAWDILGHMDYIKRYCTYVSHGFTYGGEWVLDVVDEILKYVIYSGKGLEVNTSGIFRVNEVYPSQNILERYLDLGGEIFTVGSDAHHPRQIARGFGEARKILTSLGVKYITRYKNRQPYFEKIN